MNVALPHNFPQLIAKLLLLIVLLLRVFSPQVFAGENRGGSIFDMGMDILNSTVGGNRDGNGNRDRRERQERTGRRNGGDEDAFTVDGIMEGIGVAQGAMVDVVGVPLTPEEKTIAGEYLHEAIRKDFKNAIRQPAQSRDRELMEAWRRLGLDDHGTGFRLYVVESDTLNAFAHIGGYIYVHSALLEVFKHYPNALALVLAHEAAHILNNDVDQYFTVYKGANGMLPGAGEIARFAYTDMFMAYSQKREYAADERGMEMVLNAGYSRSGALRMFDLLARDEPDSGRNSDDSLFASIEHHFSTHPSPAARRARQER